MLNHARSALFLILTLVFILPSLPAQDGGNSVLSQTASKLEETLNSGSNESDNETSKTKSEDKETTVTTDTGDESFLSRALTPENAEEGTVWHEILQFLNIQLAVIDGDPIRIKNILLAIIVLLLGLWIARRIGKQTEKRLRTGKRMSRDAAYLMQKVVMYLLAIIVVFFSLDLAGIPLTIFTFAGGAIAIAIGFGAQEILANFLSGVMLMTERPIRLGDLIEYDGQRGKVEEIKFRCTHLRMPGNVHLIVPNRELVENRIINWTLQDKRVRTEVEVGIAYGSPTRQAEELIYKAVTEHEDVEDEPKPIVLFESFGDNSLVFRTFFWVVVRDFMDQRRIMSAIRFRIDDLFRDANITIAFPQRDVHLDTLSPLRIQLERGGKRTGADEEQRQSHEDRQREESDRKELDSSNTRDDERKEEKNRSVKSRSSEYDEVDEEIRDRREREQSDEEEDPDKRE